MLKRITVITMILIVSCGVGFAETFNNVYLGDVGHGAPWAGFAHKDIYGTLTYALLQQNDGAYTLINKKDTGSGFIGFRVNNADKMVIANNGNVGIGTTTPETALRIWRNPGQGDAVLALTGGSCNTLVISEGDSPTCASPTNYAKILYDGADLRLGSNNVETLNFKWDNVNKVVNVGIGTTTPAVKLDVTGIIASRGTDSALYITPVAGGQTRLKTNGASQWMSFADGAGTTDVLVVKNGSVSIGTAIPQSGRALTVSGSGYFTGIVTTGSSRSLKHDIRPLSPGDAMAALEGIEPMRFKYNGSDEDDKLGFISEDVPALVAEKDRKSLNSMDLVALAIAVIKEQQGTIEAQEARIEKLEKLLAEMK